MYPPNIPSTRCAGAGSYGDEKSPALRQAGQSHVIAIRGPRDKSAEARQTIPRVAGGSKRAGGAGRRRGREGICVGGPCHRVAVRPGVNPDGPMALLAEKNKVETGVGLPVRRRHFDECRRIKTQGRASPRALLMHLRQSAHSFTASKMRVSLAPTSYWQGRNI